MSAEAIVPPLREFVAARRAELAELALEMARAPPYAPPDVDVLATGAANVDERGEPPAMGDGSESARKPRPLVEALRPRLTGFTDGEITAARLPHPHLWRDGQRAAFPIGEASLLAAPGREGKTRALVGLAVSHILGRPVAGMAPERTGRIVVLSAEDSRESYARALLPHLERLGDADRRQVLADFIVPDFDAPELANFRRLVATIDRAPMVAPEVAEIVEALRPLTEGPRPLAWILVETTSTWSGGADETNPALAAMALACRTIARELGVAVTLSHHTSQASRAALPALELDVAAVRGGTALVCNTRQTWMLANLGSADQPFPESDARETLRRMVAMGSAHRFGLLVALDSSKAADPRPILFRWEPSADGPAVVPAAMPFDLAGCTWPQLRAQLSGAKAAAKAASAAEKAEAMVAEVVARVRTLHAEGTPPTARQVSLSFGKGSAWATPHLEAAVARGDLVAALETVPRVREPVRVYRPRGDA